MKRFLSIGILLSAICYLLFASSVRADFDESYRNYLYQYDQYRNSLTNFQTAKNRYLTYQTLTSQTEALTATKSFLESRDQLAIVYLQMLLEKNPSDNFRKLIEDDISFYQKEKSLVPAVGSLDDGVDNSKDFVSHYPQTVVSAQQTIADILINKVKVLDNRVASLSGNMTIQVNLLKGKGKDVNMLERWLLETQNKILLCETKLEQAQALSNKLRPSSNYQQNSQEFSNVQVGVLEANQYLKEAISYLKEIKEELKYGNY